MGSSRINLNNLSIIVLLILFTIISIVNSEVNLDKISKLNRKNRLVKRFSDNFSDNLNDGKIYFPDDETVKRISRQESNLAPTNYTDNVIPMDLIKYINTIQDSDQFFEELIDKDTVDPRDQAVMSSRFGGVERSAAISPRPASCIPELQIIPLIPENDTKDPSVVYFPSCTRVKRCGGCCTHKLLSCQPTKNETKTFQIVKSKYVGGTKMAYAGKELVIVDEHLECKCDCSIKESDCNAYQRYDKPQCKCLCTNIDDQNKCLRQNDIKIWDSSSCLCKCRETKECTTGSYFDQNQCRCLNVLTSGILTETEIQNRRRLILKAVPVSQ